MDVSSDTCSFPQPSSRTTVLASVASSICEFISFSFLFLVIFFPSLSVKAERTLSSYISCYGRVYKKSKRSFRFYAITRCMRDKLEIMIHSDDRVSSSRSAEESRSEGGSIKVSGLWKMIVAGPLPHKLRVRFSWLRNSRSKGF